MVIARGNLSGENFSFSSCVDSDVWHSDKGPAGYEWWYFDALSDDARDAIVISFFDNFVFSPRYNNANRSVSNGGVPDANAESYPAVAFFYYRDGKPVYRSITEYGSDMFSADPDWPFCRIGESFFRLDTAPYGSGYDVQVKLKLGNGKNLEASFEWLSIENDLRPGNAGISVDGHFWNLVAPRSDVTGKCTITDNDGHELDQIHFRGTGSHDHNWDGRWLPGAVNCWNRGKIHFTDSTAIYFEYIGVKETDHHSKLYIVKNNEIIERDAVFETQEIGRDRLGRKYPKRLKIVAEDNLKLRVKRKKVIDPSFFYTRFIDDATLTLRDGTPRRSDGIGECLSTRHLKYSWLDWFVDSRIQKGGSGKGR